MTTPDDDEYLAIFLPPAVAKRLAEGARMTGMPFAEFVQALVDNWVATMGEALDELAKQDEAWGEAAFIEWMVEQVGEETLSADEIRSMAAKAAQLHTAEAAERGKAHLALDHVEIQGNTAHCRHCRTTFARPSTADLATYEEEMRAFAEQHQDCKPRDFRDTDCSGR